MGFLTFLVFTMLII